jgi:hypothetical protein
MNIIRFAKGYFRYRGYHKMYRRVLIKALTEVELASQTMSFVNVKAEDAFSTYTKVLDASEATMDECQRLIDAVNKDAHSPLFVKTDALHVARIYHTVSRMYAFTAAALSVMGGFQPLRAREILEIEIKYPIVEDLPTR